MTLDEVLQECARNTYNTKTIVRTGGVYSGKGLEYVNRLLSGINYAMGMIARRKIGIVTSETVTLDSYGKFNLRDDLTYNCVKLLGVKYSETSMTFEVDNVEDVEVKGAGAADVTVIYEYKPDDLTLSDLDTEMPLDERYVDPHVYAQYANYQFLSEEGTEYDSARAQVWLSLFNDSFAAISAVNRLPKRVRYNG